MKPTKVEISKILADHLLFLTGSGGRRANLSGANLSGVDLSGVDLSWANLSGANLSGANLSWANLSGANLSVVDLSGVDLSRANLSGANLSGANLSGVDLSGANLSWANLSGANLSGANLSGVDLSGANLSGANLSGVDLSRANLSGANLSGANLSGAENTDLSMASTAILPLGTLIGWKKVVTETGYGIVKLEIPADSPRSNATGRKCRAKHVFVLDGTGVSSYDGKTKYAPGMRVECDHWDENRWNECSGGIHFFITREEAEAYIL